MHHHNNQVNKQTSEILTSETDKILFDNVCLKHTEL